MPSLRSAMFAGYNKFDDAKVRIGSWREELAMKELTGVTRLAHPKNKAVFNETGVRVLYHADRSEANGAGKSTSEESFVHPDTVQSMKNRCRHNQPGPSAVRSKQMRTAIIKAEEASRDSLQAHKKKEGDFNTTFRQSFVRYSDEASKAARPKSLKPELSPDAQKTPKALTHDSIEDITTKAESDHYSTGKTITLWNTEGLPPNVATAQPSFGRTEAYPDPAPHHRLLPTGLSDLEASSLMFLKRRVLERAQETQLPTLRALWWLLWPRTYRDAVGKIGPREFREGIAEFKVPVTPCELWAVTTAFDTDGSGQICLDKLIHFFREGGLLQPRRDMVRAAFQRLDPNITGIVELHRIRDGLNFSGSNAVINGKATEEQVGTMLLQHFSHHKRCEGHEEDEAVVTFEQFQEAFCDIGAACPPPLACSSGSTAAACCNKRTGSGSNDDDDLLFRSILTCLG